MAKRKRPPVKLFRLFVTDGYESHYEVWFYNPNGSTREFKRIINEAIQQQFEQVIMPRIRRDMKLGRRTWTPDFFKSSAYNKRSTLEYVGTRLDELRPKDEAGVRIEAVYEALERAGYQRVSPVGTYAIVDSESLLDALEEYGLKRFAKEVERWRERFNVSSEEWS